MKITSCIVNSLPIVIIDDFYDIRALDKIWSEIQFLSLCDQWLDPPSTGSAATIQSDGSKHYLKKNKGLYLDDIYRNRKISHILTENRKIFSSDVVEKLLDISIIFRYVQSCNSDCTLLSYYEDSDYYESHIDDSTITLVSWFFRTPKKFQGGELVFEGDIKIACEFNRTVLFPSILKHSVTTIQMDQYDKMKRLGRYTITQLLSYKL